jgi:hypothetical protein
MNHSEVRAPDTGDVMQTDSEDDDDVPLAVKIANLRKIHEELEANEGESVAKRPKVAHEDEIQQNAGAAHIEQAGEAQENAMQVDAVVAQPPDPRAEKWLKEEKDFQDRVDARTEHFINCAIARKGVFRKKYNEWLDRKSTQAEFDNHFEWAFYARSCARKQKQDASKEIRKKYACSLCLEPFAPDDQDIPMCSGALVKGHTGKTFKLAFTHFPDQVVGEKNVFKQIDKRTRVARVFAEAHNGNSFLQSLFHCFRKMAEISKTIRMLFRMTEDRALYNINICFTMPESFYAPLIDGDAEAILTSGTLAYQALTGRCTKYICKLCSRKNGLVNNADKLEPVFCDLCYKTGTAQPILDALKKTIKDKKAAAYREERPERELELTYRLPDQITLVDDDRTNGLWVGGTGKKLIKEKPYDGKAYSATEVRALTKVQRNTMSRVSVESEIELEFILVADNSRPFDLLADEFKHHFGPAAYKLITTYFDVQPSSNKLVPKGMEVSEDERDDSVDSDDSDDSDDEV